MVADRLLAAQLLLSVTLIMPLKWLRALNPFGAPCIHKSRARYPPSSSAARPWGASALCRGPRPAVGYHCASPLNAGVSPRRCKLGSPTRGAEGNLSSRSQLLVSRALVPLERPANPEGVGRSIPRPGLCLSPDAWKSVWPSSDLSQQAAGCLNNWLSLEALEALPLILSAL